MASSKEANMGELCRQVVVVGKRGVGEAKDVKRLLIKGRYPGEGAVVRCEPYHPVKGSKKGRLLGEVVVLDNLCELRDLELAVRASES